MIANGDEWDTAGSGADEAEEGVGVVNGGGVENRRHRFGEGAHHRNHKFSGNASEVLRPRRPLHGACHFTLPRIEIDIAKCLLANFLFFHGT